MKLKQEVSDKFDEVRRLWWEEKKNVDRFSVGVETESKVKEFNPSQFLFFNDRESSSLMLSGGYRSGKTDIMLRKALFLSLIFPGNAGLLGRKTQTEIEVVTLNDFRNICDPLLYNHQVKNGILEFFNGSKIYLRGLDVLQGGGEKDVKKAIEFIRGLNLGWYGIDQAEGVDRIIVEHLDARLSLDVPFHQALLNCNPTNFWAYDLYKVEKPQGYRLIEVSLMENAHNLPKDYVEKQKSTEYSRPRYYKQYVLGHWDEFMSSENTVLEPFSLEKLTSQVREPLREYNGWSIYKEPNERHVYQIGGDPSEGKHDRASGTVVDMITGEKVASYSKTILYDVFAEKIWKIHQFYRNVKRVVPESNNFAFIMELQNYRVNLYRDKSFGTEDAKEKDRIGFRTTRDKKLYLVQNFEQLLAEGKATVYDKETVNQFHTFINNGTKMEAMNGKYDDDVMSTLLAYVDVEPEVEYENKYDHIMEVLRKKTYLNIFDTMGNRKENKKLVPYI